MTSPFASTPATNSAQQSSMGDQASAEDRITYHAFSDGAIQSCTQTSPSTDLLSQSDPNRQLRYIWEYLKLLNCRAIVVENHYIDRDYMEDHSVFYSRSLRDYPNFCRRLHFFSSTED